MDLQGIASAVADVVNPNISVSIQTSTGYSNTGPGLRQVPTYAAPVTGFAQVQAITSSGLRQIEGLNIQGVFRTLYIQGELNAIIRPLLKGGDLVTIGSQTWLVVGTPEQWPLWTEAIIWLQDPAN